MDYPRNDSLGNPMLPVDIVLHPSWWHRHEGILFDEDFFYHPARRVEVERQMERALYERWGRWGLGADHQRDVPQVGPVHLAAGCRVEYYENAPPQVFAANLDAPRISREAPFASAAFRRYEHLVDRLKTKYGYVCGDIGWGGVLNTALDLRGQDFFLDMMDMPESASRFVADIAAVLERFTCAMRAATGSTSISVNRNVRHIPAPVLLHSECSNVMISTELYERFFLPLDAAWSRRYRPYGIHHCGHDPHRFAASYAKLPHLDFLDVGWGGDVAQLRRHLPHTFLNIRLSPVEIVGQSPEEIRATVRRLVQASGNPYLTGVCCINMDDRVRDDQVAAIFEEVERLREDYTTASSSPIG